ncbi:hypothetical protein B0H12DRAFT_1136304 [Mycena haematopus]|nr:hypothetical protein B0H12DRAFT_1136304 [Mycena haematopus]
MATGCLPIYPSPQDALRDPEKWNSNWDALLRRELVFPSGPHRLFQFVMMVNTVHANGLQGALAEYPVLVSSTCAIQREITEEALVYFSRADLETTWMDAGADARGKHLLDAMATVCSKARNLNHARCYCPELSLERLRADGKVFLDLLKSVMLEDASFIPTEPKFVSHPGWDAWAVEQKKLNDSELKKISFAEILILRTKLISHVVHFTLRSFFGLPPPEFFVQKVYKSGQKPKIPALPSPLVELLGGKDAAKALFKDDKAAMKARHSQRLNNCSYLSCTKTEMPDGSVKFSRCKQCFEKMQRQVLYCSAACQKADWKLRHKAVCGKALDFETVSRPVENPICAQTAPTRIGLPINGYKRSLALTAQVTALNMNPSVDYQLYDANNQAVNIDFGAGQYPQVVFRSRRELAMTTGNPACVALMSHYLCALLIAKGGPSKLGGITPNMIVAQLAREFGLTDLRERVLAAQRLQQRDPLRRPPLLVHAPPDLWAVLNKDVNLSEVVVTLD